MDLVYLLIVTIAPIFLLFACYSSFGKYVMTKLFFGGEEPPSYIGYVSWMKDYPSPPPSPLGASPLDDSLWPHGSDLAAVPDFSLLTASPKPRYRTHEHHTGLGSPLACEDTPLTTPIKEKEIKLTLPVIKEPSPIRPTSYKKKMDGDRRHSSVEIEGACASSDGEIWRVGRRVVLHAR